MDAAQTAERLLQSDEPDSSTVTTSCVEAGKREIDSIRDRHVSRRVFSTMISTPGTSAERYERPTRQSASSGSIPVDRPLGRLAWAITLLAFTILVSVAATHLHIGAELDDSCAICAAFGVGKLKGPAPSVVASVPVAITWFQLEPQRPPSLPHNVVVVILPPSCGPPTIA